MNTYQYHTKSTIKELLTALGTRGKATRRGILYLFSCQRADERAINDAKYRNNQGFSAATAHAGSVIAKKMISNFPLTPQEWRKANDICKTHAVQLARRANVKSMAVRKARIKAMMAAPSLAQWRLDSRHHDLNYRLDESQARMLENRYKALG